MSIPRRLLRAAIQKLREGVDAEETGWIPGSSRRSGAVPDARAELENFLKGPSFEPPPPPPTHPLTADYVLLGLQPGAGAEAVRRAWRRCVRENHPDRFAGNDEEQARASERFLELQQAYERILASL